MIQNKARLGVLITLLFCVPCTGADWLRFRGPLGSGVAADSQLPKAWMKDGADNIAWKVGLPGRGASGPIVVGSRLYLTCCTGFRLDRLHLLCIDTLDGSIDWERQLWATGRTMTHPSICTASSTPVSDGRRIYCYFSSNDVACYDLDGNLLWLRGLMMEYPNASNSLGLASSPMIVGQTLVLPIENESQSIALGLDAETGETKWQLDRPKSGNWTTPVMLMTSQESPAIGLQSGPMLSVHNPETGEETWRYSQDCATIPSSVTNGQVLYIPSQGLTALRFTQGAGVVLWQNNRLGPSTATPLVYDDKVFIVSGSILKCADAESGRLISQLRLKGNFSSSPVAAGGRIYLFNEDGLGQVIEVRDKQLKLVGGGDFEETILCSPAVAEGALYIRSDGHLWKIADTSQGG